MKHLKKFWFIYLLSLVFLIFLMICIFWHEFYLYLFDSPDHKFQWIGATSIITVITLGINAWDSRRKFKADLISKSRIKWIEDVRNATAGLIQSFYNKHSHEVTKYGILLRLYFANDGAGIPKANKENLILKEVTTKNRVEWTNNQKIINVLINKESNVGKNSYLNSYISNVIPLITGRVEPSGPYEMIRIMESGVTGIEKVESAEQMCGLYISNICEIIRIYLKIEWDRAKKGE